MLRVLPTRSVLPSRAPEASALPEAHVLVHPSAHALAHVLVHALMDPKSIILRGPNGDRVLPPEGVVESVGPAGSRRFDWSCPATSPLDSISLVFEPGVDRGSKYFRNGYQSWSFAGVDTADGAVARTGLDLFCDAQHSIRRPAVDVFGESSQFLAAERLVIGFAECRRANGTIYLTDAGVEAVLDLKRGEFSEGDDLESIYLWEGDDVAAALDAFLDEAAIVGGARSKAPHMSGWCSWYHYFHAISETALDANLAEATSRFAGSFDLFQLDDGYQRAIGDWLETNEKFSSGLDEIAGRIDATGMLPGIWYAPFVTYTDARGYREDLLARQDDGSPMPAIVNLEWGGTGLGYALDTTNPEVIAMLEETAAGFVERGFRYLKLDFTYAASMDAIRYGPATKAEALKLGLDAIRRGAGDAYLLGCGMPLWPAIGEVDAMRIGQDVAPTWEPDMAIEGLTESLPSTKSAYGNTVARARMHRRLWVNDPDCVMLRQSETSLTPEQIRGWADLVADSGELLLLSDDLALVDDVDYWRSLVERNASADNSPPWAPEDPLAIQAY